MDPLEKFIKENKEALKEKHPDKNALWDKIDTDLSTTQPDQDVVVKKKEAKVLTISYKFLTRAAAVLVLLGCTTFFFLNNQNEESRVVMTEEFMEIETHYKTMVHAKVKQVNNNKNLTAKQKKEFITYINDLEDEAKDLNDELSKNLNNDKILEALINNYKDRLRLMEQLLDRADKINNNEENNIII